jgi:hypothetical protein
LTQGDKSDKIAKTNMPRENITVYNEASLKLPHYLKRELGKLLITVPVKEGKAGPFDEVFDFALSRDSLRSVVPVSDRITENKPGLEYLSFSKPEIKDNMQSLTMINKTSKPNDEKSRFAYQSFLSDVFGHISLRVKELVEGETPVFLPPLRGADLIRAYFRNNGFKIDRSNTVDYELKRTKLEDGTFLVGANYVNIPEGDFTSAVILDDCIASDVSASASVHKIMEKYPKIKKIIVAVSAASQRGLESLQQEFADSGIELYLIAATPVFEMNEDFYLLRTAEEGFDQGTQYVGDMGAWAEKLSDDFNKIAPWNMQR